MFIRVWTYHGCDIKCKHVCMRERGHVPCGAPGAHGANNCYLFKSTNLGFAGHNMSRCPCAWRYILLFITCPTTCSTGNKSIAPFKSVSRCWASGAQMKLTAWIAFRICRLFMCLVDIMETVCVWEINCFHIAA